MVDPETRSRMMASIRGRDTKPELQLRRALHARGFRFRLCVAGVPGRPDLLFPRFSAALFVNGCFWHGHDCPLFRLPGTRTEFWAAKIARNRARDRKVSAALAALGWRQLSVWECALRGRRRWDFAHLVDRIALWLREGQPTFQIGGIA